MRRDTFDWASRTCNNTIVLPNLCMLHANMRNRVHASFSHAGDTPSLSTVPPTYLVRPAHVNVSHKCDALLWGPQTTEYLKYCWLHDLNVDLKPSDLDLADRFVPGVICIHCHLGWAPFMGPFMWIIILNWWYNHPHMHEFIVVNPKLKCRPTMPRAQRVQMRWICESWPSIVVWFTIFS